MAGRGRGGDWVSTNDLHSLLVDLCTGSSVKASMSTALSEEKWSPRLMPCGSSAQATAD